MKRIVGLFLILLSTPSWAIRLDPESIYLATQESCTQVSEADLRTLKFDRLNAGYFPGAHFTELLTMIRRESLNQALTSFDFFETVDTTKIILHETSNFKKALEFCYPNNIRMQNFFIDSIIKADQAGKKLSFLLTVVGLKGIGNILNKIKNYSQRTYKSLMLANNSAMTLVITNLLSSDNPQERVELNVQIEKILSSDNVNKEAAQRLHDAQNSYNLIKQAILKEINKELEVNQDPEQKTLLWKQKRAIEAEVL